MEKILHTTQRSFFVNMSVVFRFFGFSDPSRFPWSFRRFGWTIEKTPLATRRCPNGKKQDWVAVDRSFLRATLHVCDCVFLHHDSMMNDSTLSALDNVKTFDERDQLHHNDNRWPILAVFLTILENYTSSIDL